MRVFTDPDPHVLEQDPYDPQLFHLPSRLHLVDPVEDVYSPLGHFVQLLLPLLVLYVFTEHLVQALEPAVEDCPAGQLEQLDFPAAEYFPAGQFKHDPDPAEEYFPAWQVEH